MLRQLGDVGSDAADLVANSTGTPLIPVPISPPKMDGIEQFVRWGAARLGGSCHAGGDARPDRALGCVDCDARFARARYRYQSHTMRALRAVAYLTNALQVRSLVAGERPPVGVADDEASVGLLDGPGRR